MFYIVAFLRAQQQKVKSIIAHFISFDERVTKNQITNCMASSNKKNKTFSKSQFMSLGHLVFGHTWWNEAVKWLRMYWEKKDNIITQSIRMKFLSCLETSLINHQLVIRGGICLGFEPLTTLRVNLLLFGHIREIPVRNRKCVKLWR